MRFLGLTVALLVAAPLLAQTSYPRDRHRDRMDTQITQTTRPWEPGASVEVSAPPSKKNRAATLYAPELDVPPEASESYDQGLAALEHKEYPEAEKDFRHATEVFPKYSSAFNALGVALRRQEKKDDARTALLEALRLNPNNAPAQKNLAAMLLEEKKLDEAERLQRKATLLQPNDPSAFVMLAYMELMRKRYDEALTASVDMQKKKWKQFPVIRMIRAEAFEAEGKRHDAIDEYKAYLKSKPDEDHKAIAQHALQRLKQKNR